MTTYVCVCGEQFQSLAEFDEHVEVEQRNDTEADR